MKFLGLFILLFAAACASHMSRGLTYSARQIYEMPSLEGQTVVLSGFVTTNGRKDRFLQFERGIRGDPLDFYPEQFDRDGVTILGPLSLLDNANQLAGRNVTIQGVVRSNYLNGRVFDPHACGRAAIVIDQPELDRLIRGRRTPALSRFSARDQRGNMMADEGRHALDQQLLRRDLRPREWHPSPDLRSVVSRAFGSASVQDLNAEAD
jgi:hypothetical protein